MKSRDNETPHTPDSDAPNSTDECRREFLKKCGRYAAYSTPAVMALLCHDEKSAHAGAIVSPTT